MRIGIDFDNTIACYDGVFHTAAIERALVPADLPNDKSSVRNFLRDAQREDQWTELQGYIYGARMDLAKPYPGVIDAIHRLQRQEHSIFIISHKTLRPYTGPNYDLHSAAHEFLARHGLSGATGAIPSEDVYFELTLAGKLARIASCRCDVFIDDLPELFTEPDFPHSTKAFLFDPLDQYPSETAMVRFRDWHDLDPLVATLDRSR